MCGICGIVALDGRAVDPAVLAAMSATLVHRGPGRAPASRGRRRPGSPRGGSRSSTSRAATSRSPTRTGSVVVVQNGEIYNHAELRARARGAPATRSARRTATPRCSSTSTRSTAPRFVERLRGHVRGRALGRRARGGSCSRATASGSSRSTTAPRRPLRVRLRAEGAAARSRASRARSTSTRSRRSSPSTRSTAPRTIFARRASCRPATCWRGSDGAVADRALRRRAAGAGATRDEPWEALADELRERLRDSVRAHLVSDVPVGVLLSGGDRLLGAGRARGRRAPAASRRSRSASRRSRSTSSSSRGTIARALRDRPPRAGRRARRRRAAADASRRRSTSRSRTRRRSPPIWCRSSPPQHVKVALSGEGGDELFGGYETYVADTLAMRTGGAARLLSPLAERAAERLRARPARLQAQALHARRAPAAARAPPRLEGDLLAGRARRAAAPRPAGHARTRWTLYRARWAETEGADDARAAAGRRPRDLPRRRPAGEDRPHEHGPLARAAGAVPRPASSPSSRSRCRRPRGCAASRRSACCARRSSRCVGREIARGRKKGFSIPAAAWLRGELEPFAREVLGADRLRRQGYFEPAAVSRLIDEHVDRREDHSRQLWGLITFSLWLEPSRG